MASRPSAPKKAAPASAGAGGPRPHDYEALTSLARSLIASMEEDLPTPHSPSNPAIQQLDRYTHYLFNFTKWVHRGDFTELQGPNAHFTSNRELANLYDEDHNILTIAQKIWDDLEKQLARGKFTDGEHKMVTVEINRLVGIVLRLSSNIRDGGGRMVSAEDETLLLGGVKLPRNASLDNLAEGARNVEQPTPGENVMGGGSAQEGPSESVGRTPARLVRIASRATSSWNPPTAVDVHKFRSRPLGPVRNLDAERTQQGPSAVATLGRKKIERYPAPKRSQREPSKPSTGASSSSTMILLPVLRGLSVPRSTQHGNPLTPQQLLPPFELPAPQPSRPMSNNPSMVQGTVIPAPPNAPTHPVPPHGEPGNISAPASASRPFSEMQSIPRESLRKANPSVESESDPMESRFQTYHRHNANLHPSPTNHQLTPDNRAQIQSAPESIQSAGRMELVNYHVYHVYHHYPNDGQPFPDPDQLIASAHVSSYGHPQHGFPAQGYLATPSTTGAHNTPARGPLPYPPQPAFAAGPAPPLPPRGRGRGRGSSMASPDNPVMSGGRGRGGESGVVVRHDNEGEADGEWEPYDDPPAQRNGNNVQRRSGQ
jgi:hypothetical protein